MYIKFDKNGWAESIYSGINKSRAEMAVLNVYWIDDVEYRLYMLDTGEPVKQTETVRNAYDAEQRELKIQSAIDSITEATAGEITDASLVVDPTEAISQQLIANPLFSVYSDAIVFDDPRVVEVMEQLGSETVEVLKRRIVKKRGV